MERAPSNRRVRTIVFVAISVAAIGYFFASSNEPEPVEDPSAETSEEYAITPEVESEAPSTSTPPDVGQSADPKPELTAVTFLEFVEQYSANRENFRARDSLTALIVNKHVQWEGYVRNVTRHPSSFYVTIWSAQGYNGPSASVTFDHEMEDELYALRPDDHVRFEGVVTRAAGSVGMEGLEIEVID